MLIIPIETRHLWYSEEQELRNGINKGKLTTGELVEYTEATKKRIQPTQYSDFIYLGEGTFIKIVSSQMIYNTD